MRIGVRDLAVPLDKDGREVPATVETMYEDDGTARKVRFLCINLGIVRELGSRCKDEPQEYWGARVVGDDFFVRKLDSLHLERPDSWERLEDDATMSPASYCEARGIAPLPFSQIVNTSAMCLDIVRRAKALAGRDAND